MCTEDKENLYKNAMHNSLIFSSVDFKFLRKT